MSTKTIATTEIGRVMSSCMVLDNKKLQIGRDTFVKFSGKYPNYRIEFLQAETFEWSSVFTFDAADEYIEKYNDLIVAAMYKLKVRSISIGKDKVYLLDTTNTLPTAEIVEFPREPVRRIVITTQAPTPAPRPEPVKPQPSVTYEVSTNVDSKTATIIGGTLVAAGLIALAVFGFRR